MNLTFVPLDVDAKCGYLCNGPYYKDSPCHRAARITLNDVALCTTHLGMMIYQMCGVKKPYWSKFETTYNPLSKLTEEDWKIINAYYQSEESRDWLNAPMGTPK